MAVKRKLTKEEFEALPKDRQADYKADAKGESYVLDLEGDDDRDSLIRARDAEKRESATAKAAREAAEKKLADAQAELEALNGNANVTNQQLIDAQKRLDKLEKQNKTLSDARAADLADIRNGHVATLRDGTAKTIAADLAGKNAGLFLPHVANRLEVVFANDEAKTGTLVIKNAQGVADPKFTVDDLKKELASNKDFAPILVASRAHGGGAPRSPFGSIGGGAPAGTPPNSTQQQSQTARNINQMTDAEVLAGIDARVQAKHNGM